MKMKNKTHSSKMLEEKYNSLINYAKSCVDTEYSTQDILSMVSDHSYINGNFPNNFSQSLINIDTLIHGDPITVMSYVGDYNMMQCEISEFQQGVLDL